jgi:hypothetical protein
MPQTFARRGKARCGFSERKRWPCTTHRHMGTMDCLACGHDNRAGEERCAACSASLRLKLCSACDAINGEDAIRCHNCNADPSLRSTWVIFGEPGGPRRALRAALWAVPLLALAVFVGYQLSSAVPEARAVTAAPLPGAAADRRAVEPPTAPPAPRVIAPVTHTRGGDYASSGSSLR